MLDKKRAKKYTESEKIKKNKETKKREKGERNKEKMRKGKREKKKEREIFFRLPNTFLFLLIFTHPLGMVLVPEPSQKSGCAFALKKFWAGG
ncbi:MAG: hypothetical protein ACRC4N_09725 [Gammaproteobacteria bacterium]